MHQDREKQDLYERFVSIVLKKTRIQPHTEALNHAQTNMQAILTVLMSSQVNWGTFATTSRVCAWMWFQVVVVRRTSSSFVGISTKRSISRQGIAKKQERVKRFQSSSREEMMVVRDQDGDEL